MDEVTTTGSLPDVTEQKTDADRENKEEEKHAEHSDLDPPVPVFEVPLLWPPRHLDQLPTARQIRSMSEDTLGRWWNYLFPIHPGLPGLEPRSSINTSMWAAVETQMGKIHEKIN